MTEQRAGAAERRAARPHDAQGLHTLAEWVAFLKDAAEVVPYVGLMHHFYSGYLDSDSFDVKRVEVAASEVGEPTLGELKEDYLLVVKHR